MKKRNFVLLEVLIAFLLVAICLLPLVKQPLKLYKSELEQLEKLELERMADWTFTEVKEILLKNEIPWEKIPEKGSKSDFFSLPAAFLQIPGHSAKKVERSFYLSGRGNRVGTNGIIYRQIWLYILLNNQKYDYRLPIERLPV